MLFLFFLQGQIPAVGWGVISTRAQKLRTSSVLAMGILLLELSPSWQCAWHWKRKSSSQECKADSLPLSHIPAMLLYQKVRSLGVDMKEDFQHIGDKVNLS